MPEDYVHKEDVKKVIRDYAIAAISKGKNELCAVDDTVEIIKRIDEMPAEKVVDIDDLPNFIDKLMQQSKNELRQSILKGAVFESVPPEPKKEVLSLHSRWRAAFMRTFLGGDNNG